MSPCHVLMLILSFTVHQVLPIQSKRVTAFLQAKIHLNTGYLISGYKEWGGGKVVAFQKNYDEERVFMFFCYFLKRQ